MDSSLSIKAIVLLHVVLGSVSQYLPPYYQPPMPGAMQAPMAARAPMGSAGAPMMISPMQMPQAFPQRRLPVMMSPYHSKALDKQYMKRRKRRPKKYYSESESSSDSGSYSSSREYLRSPKRGRKKKRQVLTPVISYVTRNGRVVYQKKIKKENAGDWLEMGKNRLTSQLIDDAEEE